MVLLILLVAALVCSTLDGDLAVKDEKLEAVEKLGRHVLEL